MSCFHQTVDTVNNLPGFNSTPQACRAQRVNISTMNLGVLKLPLCTSIFFFFLTPS